jgi:GTP cyclohydrolase-4
MQRSHKVYLGLGANLGDRQSNLTQALQHLRTKSSVDQVSAFYQTRPVGYLDQPDFLNIACLITTDLSPLELLHLAKQIEKIMGRQASFRNAPRPIDIDILLYDDLVLDSPELTIPHPRMAERAFVLVPLAEIAPQAVHPSTGLTIAALLKQVDQSEVEFHSRGLRFALGRDVQQSTPEIHVGLSRAGVTNLHRIIRITRGGDEHLFYAQIDLFADLNPTQMGVHMSRFGDVLEEIVDEITFEKSPNIETMASRISQQVVTSQKAVRSEVQIRAVYPMDKVAPVSGKKMQELYTLTSIAVSNHRGSKHIVGVEVDGMTVCPCAQEMVRDYSTERLIEEGFTHAQIERILNVIPIASHNQRGRGTLMIGTSQEIHAEDLVHIVESSMSSETYDVLKRPDELFVVNKAHRNPRFVEDVVREVLFNVVETYSELPDSSFILAKQVNLESIHKHNAFAERFGTLGEIRQEILAVQQVSRHTTLQEWLEDSHGI